jgi:hypothetical protein
VDGVEVPGETPATTLVSHMCCVGLHCLAEGSHIATIHVFESPKQHTGGRRCHNNEEVEVAVCE